jgi:leucyl aminopeptidase
MRITAATAAAGVPVHLVAAAGELPEGLRAAGARKLALGPVAVLDGADGPAVAALAPAWSDTLAVRRRFGAIARAATAERLDALAVHLPAAVGASSLDAIVGGLAMGAYLDDVRLGKKPVRIQRITLVHPMAKTWRTALAGAVVLAETTAQARDWVNAPAMELGPQEFAADLRRFAKAHGLRFRLHDAAACGRMGLGCLLGTGLGSHRPPCLVELAIPGKGRPLALCGKGVCFDTGGLDLKPEKAMALMRKDMAGAATVAAALAAAKARGCRRPVTAFLPLVENAIGPMAMRPGDVLTAGDGTTVEIGNTDAEGRLILADAIVRARAADAAAIVTVATLTGAALVALGRIHVPLMGTDDHLLAAIERAAAATGERVWRLPLVDEHRAAMKGTVADLRNDGDGEAGCITAGAFMAHFARDTSFAHLDISPASWIPKGHDLGPAGATGVMVATLVRLLES